MRLRSPARVPAPCSACWPPTAATRRRQPSGLHSPALLRRRQARPSPPPLPAPAIKSLALPMSRRTHLYALSTSRLQRLWVGAAHPPTYTPPPPTDFPRTSAICSLPPLRSCRTRTTRSHVSPVSHPPGWPLAAACTSSMQAATAAALRSLVSWTCKCVCSQQRGQLASAVAGGARTPPAASAAALESRPSEPASLLAVLFEECARVVVRPDLDAIACELNWWVGWVGSSTDLRPAAADRCRLLPAHVWRAAVRTPLMHWHRRPIDAPPSQS